MIKKRQKMNFYKFYGRFKEIGLLRNLGPVFDWL